VSTADGDTVIPGDVDREWAAWPIVEQPVYTTTADTVRDTGTGLVWQRSVLSQTYTWQLAKEYCAGLSLGGFASGWRLPTAIELLSIVDITRANPAIDTTAFPSTPSGWFWSSSPSVYGSSAWGVDVSYGSAGPSDVSYGGRVRCVR
jgi:hypothetical protein